MNNDLTAEETRKFILNSPYLYASYNSLYKEMVKLTDTYGFSNAVKIEIGSSGGFLRNLIPDLITSDVRPDLQLSLVSSGTALPFQDETLGAIYLKDTLHHIPDVNSFFLDALRALGPGGVIVCADPYWGLLAQLIYRFFHPEPFDKSSKEWAFESTNFFMANQALLWKVIVRDAERFSSLYPEFEIIRIRPTIGLSYILSGGVTGKQIVPSWFLLRLHQFETRTNFWRKHFAMTYLCVFRKKPTFS